MAIICETERLTLRTLKVDDIDAILNFWGDDEVMKYCGGATRDRARLEKSISFYANAQEKRGYSVYAVILKETGEVIGACGYNPTEEKHEIELIYHFSKDHWGKGYATEAGRACVEYAKENLKTKNIEVISASMDPEHIGSRKVLEKLGFDYKGIKWFDDSQQEEPYFELVL